MKVGIIGAGITGLYLGYKLSERGYDVHLYEKAKPGGLAFGFPFFQKNKFYLEKYYHHIFKSDSEILKLIKENHLDSNLLWFSSNIGIYTHGKIWDLDTPLDFLLFSPIGNFWQRILMGLNLFYFKKTKKWEHLDSLKCQDFFASRWNLKGYKNLWEPLLKQKFSQNYDNIPTSFLWGRIHPRSQSREDGKEALGYLLGGFQRLFNAMAGVIEDRYGKVSVNDQILKIIPGRHPTVLSKKGEQRFDRLIWTISLNQMPSVIKEVTQPIIQKINSIRYMAVTCLVLIMDRQLSNYYWLNNIDPDISFGALIEHTNLVPSSFYNGHNIVYIANYHNFNDPISQLSLNDVYKMHLPSLLKIYPNITKAVILRKYLFRDIYSCPLYNLGYLKRIPPYQGWINKVDICNMAQVYPLDRNMNNCLINANNYLSSLIN